MTRPRRYVVELGLDMNARRLDSMHPDHFFLPAAITRIRRRHGDREERVLSTYTELRVGDRIGLQVYDITHYASSVSPPRLKSLELSFQPARTLMPLDPPICGSLISERFKVKDSPSIIFPLLQDTNCHRAYFCGRRFLHISNPGFFKSSYKLTVEDPAKPDRNCIHDPEWIIDEDDVEPSRNDKLR